ncbi:hypothetical protein BJ742DRAFT_672414 [Cladochytrium replicatum]|nr:hypothetical protein BJ742DRAFT_672414 [Cladochytrium replicatum]
MNNTGVLPAIRQHGTRSSQYGPGNTASSVDRGVDGTAGGTDSDPAVADKRPAATSLLVDPEGETIPYKPFELSARSSFNPARLSRRQMERLDPHIRAKYLAYEAPPPIVARRIEESDLRVRRWSREERLRMLATMENARMIWERMHGIERNKIQQLIAAKVRAQNKIENSTYSEAELQFLVEGQATALEAIRLKEHVGVRKMGKVQLGKVYSKRDRQRVADLLS